MYDKSSMWSVIDKLSGYHRQQNMPTKHELRHHFVELAIPPVKDYFCEDYFEHARTFLLDHDKDGNFINGWKLELEVINNVFALEEIIEVIDALKNNESPGCDGIPAEFIMTCKTDLAGLIVYMSNYMVEKRDFPDAWAEGLRLTIFKSGDRLCVENYRGITVLSIFAKIFELAVYNRLYFTNECFAKVDEFNGGFLKNSRTTDNLFILQGVIQKQSYLGKTSLYALSIFKSVWRNQ